ncbi:MAG: hypothetical protein HDT26_09215 [Subdoligranulum sp.]|nr:hypothetical protein [Subdoligranulum sp.]
MALGFVRTIKQILRLQMRLQNLFFFLGRILDCILKGEMLLWKLPGMHFPARRCCASERMILEETSKAARPSFFQIPQNTKRGSVQKEKGRKKRRLAKEKGHKKAPDEAPHGVARDA